MVLAYMPKLIYLPLESYQERYTYFMSSVNGWAETHFRNYGVEFIRVEGNGGDGRINTGSVVDAFGRSSWALEQIKRTIELIKSGQVKDNDVIFTEDFWHSGVDSLFYIRELTKIKFKVACFIHAQSVDDSDFTYPFRNWMRPIEVGYSQGYNYIFTCSEILQKWCELAGYKKPIVTGLPFNSRRLEAQLDELGLIYKPKVKQVLFSSRFDSEKNPHFFLRLVESMSDVQFVLCKPRQHLSDDLSVGVWARRLKNLRIVDTSDKLTYYGLLTESKVQFNCANQDWVSWTLLEATLFGCVPVYPYHKDFPLELDYNNKFLYKHLDIDEARARVREALDNDYFVPPVYKKHDLSWAKQLKLMGWSIA